ncbi:hypothetical protein MTYP_01685 [Methylophilaceae bacterium]|nr:hypothetical protein MTYP_01685 [Methylophilaceae bacterium]
MMRVLILAMVLVTGGISVHAGEAGQDKSIAGVAESVPREQGAPSGTRAWLELQRSGQAASAQPQPISGQAMDKIHERYINSFGKPIPEFYDHAAPVAK